MSKRLVDDFLEVLRWSKDFGVDTTDGRELRQGVVGVFAAGVFDPREHVEVRGERITLPQYAGRRNLQIITASDFNGKLRERGCYSTISVQKLCRAARDEGEVRETLDLLWRKPEDADRVLGGLLAGNEEFYRFEEMLEGEGEASISS